MLDFLNIFFYFTSGNILFALTGMLIPVKIAVVKREILSTSNPKKPASSLHVLLSYPILL